MVSKSKNGAASASHENFETYELLALARVDIEKGDLADALLKLKHVVSDDSAPTEAFGMLARLYAQLRLWDRAREMYEKHLGREPNAVLESFQLGMVYFDSGNPAEALTIWDKVLKSNPTFPPALFYRGLVLAQHGRQADAQQVLETLLKTTPTDNLYFGRAKELLQELSASAAKSNTVSALSAAKDVYKTEH